jgi:hypothetical protein
LLWSPKPKADGESGKMEFFEKPKHKKVVSFSFCSLWNSFFLDVLDACAQLPQLAVNIFVAAIHKMGDPRNTRD